MRKLINKLDGILLGIVVLTVSLTIAGINPKEAISIVNNILKILFQNVSDMIIYFIR